MTANQPLNSRNNRILIIDDNPAIHEDIRKILVGREHDDAGLAEAKALLFGEAAVAEDHTGFDLASAFQGQEGLRQVEAAEQAGQPFAVAFVDVRMPPGWDGVETIERIWQRHPQLQVVICTAYSDYSWEEMIRRLGKSDSLVILKKPFDNIEVLQLAHALTEKWRLSHEVKCRLQNLDLLVTQRTAELQLANAQLRQESAERLRLEHQMRQAQKLDAVGQLAAGIAHDFNNILTVVQGHAGLLLSAALPESKDRRSLETIATAAERASKLIRQLLTFSRKQVIQMRPIAIQATLAAIAEMLPRVLSEAIVVKVNPPSGLLQINADAGMMEQMLMNLAVNARDAMPEGGRLTISAEAVDLRPPQARDNQEARAGAFLRLSVADTGCGIPPEVLPRIFEPFFITKPVGKGTGLGLSTVYGIVKQHDGWVEVRSQPGHGTTFQIFLPTCAAAPVASPAPPAPQPVPGGHETVLVAEDEAAVRALVVRALKSYGYKVIAASSGKEALERYAEGKEKVHLLLTDMVMPDGVTGRQLAEGLLAQDPSLRVIYTSGYSPGMAGKDLASLEGLDFLAKPYELATLVQRVRASLDGRPPSRPGVAAAAVGQML